MENFKFGIYPLATAGTDSGLTDVSANDDAALIFQNLILLKGGVDDFYVRLYVHYLGKGKIKDYKFPNYLFPGFKVNLVFQYLANEYDADDWKAQIRQFLDKYAPHLHSIQVVEEPNLYHIPIMDGSKPNVRNALVDGVLEAKKHVLEKGYDIKVGFNAVPNFDPKDDFWASLKTLGGEAFAKAVNFVGLDFFPDVFRPLPADNQPDNLVESVQGLLNIFRNQRLIEAGIPDTTPIYITENGWPTSSTRSAERQAEVLGRIIRLVFENRSKFNITHYFLFGLRDGDSKVDDIFYQFGILRDDYSAKPAFEVFRKLISELSNS